MNKPVLIIGGEGGSIALFGVNGRFSRSANNTADIDMLDEEDQKEILEMIAKEPLPPSFSTFEEALVDLMDTYSVFSFSPVHLAKEHREVVKNHFDIAKQSERYAGGWRLDRWQEFLDGDKEDWES